MSLGACFGPMQEMGMNFKHRGIVDCRQKHWDAWFLNSSKSKTRLKFMKLGMLSWCGINMPWYKICPIWGRFEYMLLTNLSFSQQAWWFSVGNVHRCGRNDIHYVLLLSIFFSCQRRTTGVLCSFFWFSGFVLTFLGINWVFNAFQVNNSNLNYMHML